MDEVSNNIDKIIRLNTVLEELALDTFLNEEKLKNYSNSFKEIYKDKFRHEYSEVTRVLFSINIDKDGRDFLAGKIKDILERLEKSNCDKETLKSVKKLWDHVNLENIRMAELENISSTVNEASKEAFANYEKAKETDIKIQDIDKKLKVFDESTTNFNKSIKKYNKDLNTAKNKMSSLQKTMKDSTTQSITILSIFAGVVMAFTGGMSYISQALVSLNSIGAYRAGVFIVLIGTVMFNLIFLLLYMIGKLTDRYIGSNYCKCKNPKIGCKNKKAKCCVRRYPYIIWFNLISLIIISSILIIVFLDKYDLFVHRFIDIITAFAWYKLFQDFCIILCVLAIYIFFGYVINKVKKIHCENNE
ncbi:hypothetical protein ACTFIN_01435 [Clostridium cagae]|uniref:hypothetical protein n=1 Tax=Clostridium cagae TaxID=2080751 RepID=UPI003F75F309